MLRTYLHIDDNYGKAIFFIYTNEKEMNIIFYKNDKN